MASASSTVASFSPSFAHFMGPKVSIKEPSSMPTLVRFRPLRISAACTSTAERTISHFASPSSLYEVLGIQMDATCQEIKAAYRRLARVLHPDVSANGQNNATASLDFIKVHEAYSTLSDPEKRADYDRTLLFRLRRSFSMSESASSMASSMSSGFSGYTRRTWETDQCW
ncbi:chaperone protein dnaJ 11, chloroplastic-like [Durio zibethinus]|uniref:Chaperone protein dnaJ 11, chloroplastic-like n=1 Tax=Durio zibethinus TaxID=66656 RepID=A0A6P6AWQ6_DURZI|nr:chaperone protein dnaJ 11, chloroplastic-like [Durio zibethinus]